MPPRPAGAECTQTRHPHIRQSPSSGVLCVYNRVLFGCFFCVVLSLYMVAVGQMSVMPCLFVVARIMVLRGGAVMLCSFFVMLCCVAMMFSAFL